MERKKKLRWRVKVVKTDKNFPVGEIVGYLGMKNLKRCMGEDLES